MPKGSRGGKRTSGRSPFDISREDYIRAYEGMARIRDSQEGNYSGRILSNSEFLAHMEDANWHSELRQLREANLTAEELTYIKNNTTLSAYGVGNELTGEKNVNAMIKRAREATKSAKVSPRSNNSTRVIGDNYRRINGMGGGPTTYAIYKGDELIRIVGNKKDADRLTGK